MTCTERASATSVTAALTPPGSHLAARHLSDIMVRKFKDHFLGRVMLNRSKTRCTQCAPKRGLSSGSRPTLRRSQRAGGGPPPAALAPGGGASDGLCAGTLPAVPGLGAGLQGLHPGEGASRLLPGAGHRLLKHLGGWPGCMSPPSPVVLQTLFCLAPE